MNMNLCTILLIVAVGRVQSQDTTNFTVLKIELAFPCQSGDICKDDFALCTRGICRCIDNYFPRDQQCVGRIPLGQRCGQTDRCEDQKAECSNGVCACISTHYEKNRQCSPIWRSQPGEILVLEWTKLVLNWTHPILPPIDITWDYKGTDSQTVLDLIMDYTTGAGVYIPIQDQWSGRIAYVRSVNGSAIMTLDNVTSADEKYYEVNVKNLDDQRYSLTDRASIDVIQKTDINTTVGIDGEIFQLSLVENGTEISLPDMIISVPVLTSIMAEVKGAAPKPRKIGIQNRVDGAIYNDHSCENNFKCERQVQFNLDPSQTAELIINVSFTVQNLPPIIIKRTVTQSVSGVTSSSVPSDTPTPDVSAASTAVDEELYTRRSDEMIGLVVGVCLGVIVIAAIVVLVLYLRRKRQAKQGSPPTFSQQTLEVGLKDYSDLTDVTAADLNKYAIKDGLPAAEYMFKFSYDDITSSARTKNEFVACLTALMNTSGGVIKVTSQRGIDVEALKSIPSPTIPRQQLKDIRVASMEPDLAYVMVTKSRYPVTFDCATFTTLHGRVEPVRDYQTVKQIVSHRGHINISAISTFSDSDDDIQFSVSDGICMRCDDPKPQRFVTMMIALANTPGGGCIASTGEIGNIPNLESVISHVQDTFKLGCSNDSSTKLMWGSTRGIPKYNEHWTVLKNLRALIVRKKSPGESIAVETEDTSWLIRVEECPGGAFLRCPDCFVIGDDGDVHKLDFETWKRFLTSSTDEGVIESNIGDELAEDEPDCVIHVHEQLPLLTEEIEDSLSLSASDQDGQQTYSWSDSDVWRRAMHTQKEPCSANWKSGINFEMFQLSSPMTCIPREEVICDIVKRKSPDWAEIFSGIFQKYDYAWMIAFSSVTKAFKHESKFSVPNTLVMDLLMASEKEGLQLCSVYTHSLDDKCKQYSLKAAILLKKYATRQMFTAEKTRHNVKQQIHVKVVAICDMGFLELEDPNLSYHLQQQFTWRAGKDTSISQAFAHMFLTGDTYVRNLLLGDLMLYRMTENQERVLSELSRMTHVFVQGPPGTGKTWIARNFCAAMSQKSDKKSVVYVCSSQAACERMRSEDTCEIHWAKDFKTLTLLADKSKAWECVVLDDAHTISNYSLSQWGDFLKRINTKQLVIFFDNVLEHAKSSTNVLTAFVDYCANSRFTFKIINMEESHRTCGKVASFLKHIWNDQRHASLLQEEDSWMRIDGDDVFLHILPTTFERCRSNAIELANYVVDLADRIIVESQSLDGPYIYGPEDVAIVIDTTKMGELYGMNDVQRFISNFESRHPKYRVQKADVSPVEGIIVDTLKNFTGLETKVLIYVIHHGMSHDTLDYLSDKRHLTHVVSRALCRVDIVYQGPYGREAVEKLGFSRSPPVSTEDNPDGYREDNVPSSALEVHQEDSAVTSPLLATPDVDGSSPAYIKLDTLPRPEVYPSGRPRTTHYDNVVAKRKTSYL